MRKMIVLCLFLLLGLLYWQCNNNSAGEYKAANNVSEISCTGEDLFPIGPPSNAQPDSSQECQFYKWAWQTFLFITQKDSTGMPRFLSYETPTKLFGIDATPLFQSADTQKMLLLAPRLTEDSIVTGFSDVMQATSKGVLIDKSGHAIYYAQHINDTFAHFVRANDFTRMDKLLAADPNLTFPRGSLELKSSWKIVGPNENVSGFFTTHAMVAQFELKHTNGRDTVVINPRNLKEERVALVGLHVVGVVAGHPEFIWATFEHDSVGPDNSNRDGLVINKPLDTASMHHYLFYRTGDSAQKCNKNNPIQGLVFADQANQTFKNVSSVYHLYWFDDDDNIEPLNNSVRKILTDSSSVWANYSFKGAVWMNDPVHKLEVGHIFSANELADSTIFGGERELSNLTMETFTQPRQRCFSCHSANDEFNNGATFPGKKIGLSHVLTNAYFNSLTASKLKLMKK